MSASSAEGLLRVNAGKKIAKGLEKAGFVTKITDHEYAVRIYEPAGPEVCVVWLPMGEWTPTGLEHDYLWGKTGVEHKAPGTSGVNEVIGLVVRSLQPAGVAPDQPTDFVLVTNRGRYHKPLRTAWGLTTPCGTEASRMSEVDAASVEYAAARSVCKRCFPPTETNQPEDSHT